jgi:hypothetical protein
MGPTVAVTAHVIQVLLLLRMAVFETVTEVLP